MTKQQYKELRLAERNALQVAVGSRPSLAEQHLEYNLVIDRSRAILTEHAMTNTEILYDLARNIAGNNPATTDALNEIMTAYLDATSDHIRAFANPYSKHRK